MATLEIPTRTDGNANYAFEIELDGAVFRFEFLFNTRENAWFFNLLDNDGNRLRSGVKVVTNFPLLRTFVDITRPAGRIQAIDTTSQDLRPGVLDLGDSVILAYEEAATVPS